MSTWPRPVAACVALALLCLALAGCGEGQTEDPTASTEVAKVVEGDEVITGEGSFPTTVEHQFGTTTIESEPQRVVSVGLTEQDILLQLGVVPVAVTEWYGDQPDATWPWAQPLLGDADPVVLEATNGIEFEAVADLDPDLIIGTNAGMTERDYELLSAIAPTVSSVSGSTAYFSSWQDQVLQVARGLGREADGEKLVAQTEEAYAQVADEHPEWDGVVATFSQGQPYDGQLYVYPDGLGVDFLTELGFEMTTGLESYANPGEQALISGENVDLIDADLIVFATEDREQYDTLMDFSTVSRLGAVEDRRAVYTDATLAGALYFLTPLSLAYALDELTPALELAVAGEGPSDYPY